jgi:hypothetical protein
VFNGVFTTPPRPRVAPGAHLGGNARGLGRLLQAVLLRDAA